MTRDYCILRHLEPGCVLRDVEVMDRVLRVNGVKGTAPALARRMHPGGVRVVGRMSPEALEFSDPSSLPCNNLEETQPFLFVFLDWFMIALQNQHFCAISIHVIVGTCSRNVFT